MRGRWWLCRTLAHHWLTPCGAFPPTWQCGKATRLGPPRCSSWARAGCLSDVMPKPSYEVGSWPGASRINATRPEGHKEAGCEPQYYLIRSRSRLSHVSVSANVPICIVTTLVRIQQASETSYTMPSIRTIYPAAVARRLVVAPRATPHFRFLSTTQPRRQSDETSANTTGLPRDTNVGGKRFADFDLAGKVFLVTGGARGLGLALAEALVEAGGRGKLLVQSYTEPSLAPLYFVWS